MTDPALPFCDWRVNVHHCVDSQYFRAFHVAAAVISGACTCWIITLAYYRAVREGLGKFQYGANLALVMVGVEAFLNFLAHVAVLASTNLVLNEVAWSGIVSSVLFPCMPYLGAIITSFPPNFNLMPFVARAQRCLQPATRDRCLLAFVFTFAAVLATVLGLAGDATMQGDLPLKNYYHRVAMLFACITFLPCLAVYLYFVIAFLKFFHQTNLVTTESKEEQEAARLNLIKIKHNFVILFLSIFVYLALLLVICFDQEFFSKLPLSKGFAAVYTLFLEINCVVGLTAITRSDYQKHVVYLKASLVTSPSPSIQDHAAQDKAFIIEMKDVVDPLDEFLSQSQK